MRHLACNGDIDLRLLKRVLETRRASVLLSSYEKRERLFITRFRRARLTPSESAVHRVRVAARRLLSMLSVLEPIMGRRYLKPVRRTLKSQLRELGAVRDVQVHVLLTGELLTGFPQLTTFHESLTRKEQKLIRHVRNGLWDFNLEKLRRQSDRIFDRLICSIDPAADDVIGDEIEASVGVAYQRVLSRQASIDPDHLGSIHRTRLAFKRFRYMAEIVAPIYNELTTERLKAMHEFQGRLGAIQDLDSLLSAMTDFRKRSGRTSMQVAENEIRQRRTRLIEDFMDSVDEVRFFWSTVSAGDHRASPPLRANPSVLSVRTR